MSEARSIVVVDVPADEAKGLVLLLAELGHRVRSGDGLPAVREGAEVALVGRGHGDEHALRVIDALARARETAVIALAPGGDGDALAYAEKAAARGAHVVVTELVAPQLGTAITCAWHSFQEYSRLLSAFERRAQIEQAKGILMARHGIGADRAFALLRQHSQRSNRKVVEIANAISQSHTLLLATSGDDASDELQHAG